MVRSYPDMSVRVIQYAPYRITFCPGFDPEFTSTGSAMGLDMGSYPSSKKVVFGLNVAF